MMTTTNNETERLIYGLLLGAEPTLGSASLRQLQSSCRNIGLKITDWWRRPRQYAACCHLNEKKLAAIEQLQQTWTLEKFHDYLAQNQWHISLITDADYPPLLKFIPDFAPVLFYHGDLTILQRPTLAVVGSRGLTNYGRAAIRQLLTGKAKQLTIVSGMMTGVDACAQAQALAIGASTVSFLGYGLAHTWPAKMIALRRKIVAQGGLIMSEYAPWSQVLPYRFPLRNRLVAGSSLATLVIEAATKSGSLITANLALDYGREVLVVPGSIFSDKSTGCLELIKTGATPVTSIDEILTTMLSSRVSYLPASFYDELRNISQTTALDLKKQKQFTDPIQNQLYHYLLKQATSSDELALVLQLDLQMVTTALSLLELAGEIKLTDNNNWCVL